MGGFGGSRGGRGRLERQHFIAPVGGQRRQPSAQRKDGGDKQAAGQKLERFSAGKRHQWLFIF
jgi:hypothetical protein